jgi:putative hydrolase of the HAD superfamily
LIRNIIFDLGNVIFEFKPDKFLLRFTEDKDYINKFVLKVIRSEIWLKLDYGTISLKNAEQKFIEI